MNRVTIPMLFWSGSVLTTIALATYYTQLTPLIFFFDRPWPMRAQLLALILSGLILCSIGVWRLRTIFKSSLLIGLLILTGWHVMSSHAVFREETVQFTSEDAQLTGTLLTPRGAGPHAAVIIIHGTAPNSRTPYRGLAEHFVRNGTATLIYDKRGFGASTGALPYTYSQLADDVINAVHTLQQHPQIDAQRIGLLGFSQGGFVGPLAADRSKEIAFLALVSGGGVSPARTVHYEMEMRMQAAGYGNAEITRALALQQQIDDAFRSGEDGETAWAAVQSATAESWFAAAFELSPTELPSSLDAIPFRADYPTDLDFDPLPHLARLEIPMLFLFGAADQQIPVAESIQAIHKTLAEAGHTDFTIETFADADHMILVNYQPAPGYLETLTNWIAANSQESAEAYD